MIVKLDTVNKTIAILSECTVFEITEFLSDIPDGHNYKIVSEFPDITIYPTYPTYITNPIYGPVGTKDINRTEGPILYKTDTTIR